MLAWIIHWTIRILAFNITARVSVLEMMKMWMESKRMSFHSSYTNQKNNTIICFAIFPSLSFGRKPWALTQFAMLSWRDDLVDQRKKIVGNISIVKFMDFPADRIGAVVLILDNHWSTSAGIQHAKQWPTHGRTGRNRRHETKTFTVTCSRVFSCLVIQH